MNCTQAEPQLNALADRALPLWQAARVQRHLAACPACAAQFTDIQSLDTAVRAWNDAPLPAALGTRIAAALPPSAALPNPQRMFPVRPAAGGLTAAAAALAAVFWFLPGQPGQPTIAFADVEKVMQQVQMAEWTQELTVYNADSKTRIHQLQQVWIRRNPAAIATTTLPDTQHPYKRQTLEDARGSITIQPNGQYILKANSHDVSLDIEAALGVFGAVLSPATKTGMGLDSATVERTSLNGHSALRFTQTFHYKTIPQMKATSQSTIWIDEKTKRCVKLEQQTSHNGRLWMTAATSHIQYDQIAPPGVFDWPTKSIQK